MFSLSWFYVQIPWSGTKILQAVWCSQIKIKQKPTSERYKEKDEKQNLFMGYIRWIAKTLCLMKQTRFERLHIT